MLNEKHMSLIEELRSFTEKTTEFTSQCEEHCSFEEGRANSIIEYINTEIGEAIAELEHLNRPAKEGVLVLNSQGRYNLDSMPSLYFTCGDIIEVYVDSNWYRGRIEHDSKDYYFCNYDGNNIPLFEGIKARVRVDRV